MHLQLFESNMPDFDREVLWGRSPIELDGESPLTVQALVDQPCKQEEQNTP